MRAMAVQQRKMIAHFIHFIWGFDFGGLLLVSTRGMGNGSLRDGGTEGRRECAISPSLFPSFSLSLCLSITPSLRLHSPLPTPHSRCLSGRVNDRSRCRR